MNANLCSPNSIHSTDFQFWRDRLLVIARKYPQLIVAMSNELEYAKELAGIGLSDRGEDVSMVIWAGPKERYVKEEDAEFEDFIDVSLALYRVKVHACKYMEKDSVIKSARTILIMNDSQYY